MTACRWVASNHPRILPGRHAEDCPDRKPKPKGAPGTSTCEGCQPCTKPHCVMPSCPGRHASEADPYVCANCVGDMRDDLHRIAELCGYQLLDQALREDDDPSASEAVMLLGPVAYPDAWYRRRELAVAGRAPRHYLEDARDEAHPLFVLGTWEMAWRDWLGHDTDQPLTIGLAASYLNLNLTYVARQPDVPMGDFAAELRRCRSHLEDVIGDAEPKPKQCPKCGGRLLMDHEARTGEYAEGNEERDYDDRWQCQRKSCGAWWTDEAYRRMVEADYELHADRLTASAIARVYRVGESTVRKWAEREQVRKRGADSAGRMLYDVRDVVAMRDRVEAS